MNEKAQVIVDALGLRPHPEGGYYRETFRSSLVVQGLPRNAPRSASTAIFFLLASGDFSAFHRVCSDEVWHHYDGSPVALHTIDASGAYQVSMLGKGMAHGELPQVVVPAGVWQAAMATGDSHALCGCTVAPGFEFEDFEMPTAAQLEQLFPQHSARIRSLCRR